MKLTVYAEPKMVSLVAETLEDAFTLGRLATRVPKSVTLTTPEGHPEVQVEIASLVKLATE